MRRIFESSSMRLCFVWRRPAVSTKRRSAFFARARRRRRRGRRRPGRRPDLCFTSGIPSRSAQTSSCSTAAARNVSAAARTTDFRGGDGARGELRGRRRLARSVHADHEDDVRRAGARPVGPGTVSRRAISAFRTRRTTSASAGVAPPGLLAHGRDELGGRRRPDVGRKERLLERLEGARDPARTSRGSRSPTFAISSVWVMNSPRFRRAKTEERVAARRSPSGLRD